LAHELSDHAVESTSFVTETFLAGAESTEVLSRAWDDIGTQSHLDAAHGGTIAGHVCTE